MGSTRRALDAHPIETPTSLTHPVLSSCPGVLILSDSGEPFYVTHSTRTMLASLRDNEADSSTVSFLPLVLKQMLDELQRSVRQHSLTTDAPHMHIQQLIHVKQDSILVRAYTIPGGPDTPCGRILFLLEVTASLSPERPRSSGSAYQFTDRQQTIINGLLRGLTNKELAQELCISIHTVKEYVRQIMMKVHVTSRTGIVARLAGSSISTQTPSAPQSSQIAPPLSIQVA